MVESQVTKEIWNFPSGQEGCKRIAMSWSKRWKSLIVAYSLRAEINSPFLLAFTLPDCLTLGFWEKVFEVEKTNKSPAGWLRAFWQLVFKSSSYIILRRQSVCSKYFYLVIFYCENLSFFLYVNHVSCKWAIILNAIPIGQCPFVVAADTHVKRLILDRIHRFL